MKTKKIFFLGILLLLLIGLKKMYDFGDYIPTVIIERKENISLKGNKFVGEFISTNDNLGIISIKIDNYSNENRESVSFRMKEVDSKDWYYINNYQIEQSKNHKYFPFGFPNINNSKDKKYRFEVEYLNTDKKGDVRMSAEKADFLVKYNFSKTYLKEHKNIIPFFLWAKLRSMFDHINYLYYVLIFSGCLLINFFIEFVSLRKIYFLLKKAINKINLGFTKNLRLNRILILFCLVIVFVINFWINEKLKIKTLAYPDDLWNLNYFNQNHNSFFNLVFNLETTKFRPVFNLVFYGLFFIFRGRPWMFGYFNVFLSFLIAAVLFYFFLEISKKKIIALCLSIAFVVSRFAYYNIGQALGIMESMALLFGVIFLYFVWKYFNFKNKIYFWWSLLSLLLLIFTHERFIVLLFLYIPVFIFLGYRGLNFWKHVLYTTPILMSFFIKLVWIGKGVFDGTGGTSVLETFSFSSFGNYFLSGCLYLLGFNAGPEYLNGIEMKGVSLNMNILIVLGVICLLTILIVNLKKLDKKIIYNLFVFLFFIGLTLASGSITIRLEMRWLYAPFVGLLFLLAYLLREKPFEKSLKTINILIILIWVGLMVPREILYRNTIKNMYFWYEQRLGNSIYETTLKKYGENFWNYELYMFCPSKNVPFVCNNDEENIILYFSQFTGLNIKIKNVHLIKNIAEMDKINIENKNIFLMLNSDKNRFIEFSPKNKSVESKDNID